MDFLGSLVDAAHITGPISQNAILTLAVALAIQALFAVPSIVAQSELCYDFSGALTFLACTALGLYRTRRHGRLFGQDSQVLFSLVVESGGSPALDWRQLAATCAVSIWSLRRELPAAKPDRLGESLTAAN